MSRHKSTASPKIVIIEGVDRSGKTTLIQELNKAARYKHITIDRGPVGFKAYCEIFDKGFDNYDEYVRMEDELAKNPQVVMIYLYASKETLEKRVEDTGHEYIDYDLHVPIYNKHFSRSPIEKKFKFNTSSTEPSSIVSNLILRGIL